MAERRGIAPGSDAPVNVEVWRGSPQGFARALEAALVPTATDLPQWPVLAGPHSLTLQARDVQRVLERFALITERDLIPPGSAYNRRRPPIPRRRRNQLEGVRIWIARQRTYQTDKGTAYGEIRAALSSLNSERLLTRTVEVPSEPGAGGSRRRSTTRISSGPRWASNNIAQERSS